MRTQLLILITDGLEGYDSLLSYLEKSEKRAVTRLSLFEFLRGDCSGEIKSRKTYNVLLGVDEEVFEKEDTAFLNYFKNVISAPFSNYLFLYTRQERFEKKRNGNRATFYLGKEWDAPVQAFYLSHFIDYCFPWAKMSFRLSDYIFESFKGVVSSEIIIKKKEEIERLNRELERMNKTDALTQLYNRRALYDALDKERKRCCRNLLAMGKGEPWMKGFVPEEELDHLSFSGGLQRGYTHFAVMMIDLDHFKRINDTHGHLVGDQVLKALGKVFRKSGILRDEDIAGRFGGEEFVIILPGTDARQAAGPARRLRNELARYTFEGIENQRFSITMSIGISQFDPRDRANDAIILRADQALYYAKEHGRDQFIIYEDQFPRKPEN